MGSGLNPTPRVPVLSCALRGLLSDGLSPTKNRPSNCLKYSAFQNSVWEWDKGPNPCETNNMAIFYFSVRELSLNSMIIREEEMAGIKNRSVMDSVVLDVQLHKKSLVL